MTHLHPSRAERGRVHNAQAARPLTRLAPGCAKLLLKGCRLLVKLHALQGGRTWAGVGGCGWMCGEGVGGWGTGSVNAWCGGERESVWKLWTEHTRSGGMGWAQDEHRMSIAGETGAGSLLPFPYIPPRHHACPPPQAPSPDHTPAAAVRPPAPSAAGLLSAPTGWRRGPPPRPVWCCGRGG